MKVHAALRSATAVIVLGSMGVVFAPQGSAAPAPTAAREVQPLTPEQLRNDIAFRESFGFRADDAYVRQLYADAAAGLVAASPAAGALLTTAEEAALVSRQHSADDVFDAATRYFASQPADVYAGGYIDGARAGLVVIGVTRDASVHARALASIVGDPAARYEVVERDTSLDALYRLQSSIDVATNDLIAQGVDISSIAVDEEANAVAVGVASDRTAATEVLRSRFGSAAPIVVDEMPHPTFHGVSYTDSPPLRGGQRIQFVRGDRLHLCTSAYVGYTVERIEAALFAYNHHLITAGHCEADAAGNAQIASAAWSQVAYPLGLSDRNVFAQGSSADAMSIPIRSVDKSPDITISYGIRNLVRCEESPADDRRGQHTAMSGSMSGGSRGGKLLNRNVVILAKHSSGRVVRLVNQREVTFASVSGDSGGSVFGSRNCAWEAQGIVSTSGTRNGRPVSTFTHIGYATKKLGITGVVTATAG